MDELGLFTAALGLSRPWRVSRSEFDPEQAQLDLYLDFERGARFGCPAKDCAHDACEVHDTTDKTWRHLYFFGAQGVPACPGTAGALPRAWRAAGQRAVGAPRVGVHAAVRGARAQLRCGDADGEGRGDDP